MEILKEVRKRFELQGRMNGWRNNVGIMREWVGELDSDEVKYRERGNVNSVETELESRGGLDNLLKIYSDDSNVRPSSREAGRIQWEGKMNDEEYIILAMDQPGYSSLECCVAIGDGSGNNLVVYVVDSEGMAQCGAMIMTPASESVGALEYYKSKA